MRCFRSRMLSYEWGSIFRVVVRARDKEEYWSFVVGENYKGKSCKYAKELEK